MARRKKIEGGGPGSGDWLNTYADMVTLLLTFFILLFSMSSLDAAKFNMLVTAFASDGESSDVIIIRGDRTSQDQDAQQETEQSEESLNEIFEFLQEMVETQSLSDSINISKGEDYVFIQFMDDMLFEPNSSVLKTKDEEILGFVGEALKSVQQDARSINIVGHTAEILSDPDYHISDRRLSVDRANVVLEFFEDIGIDGEKLYATGYGKWHPIADNSTSEGMSKNRRVEILVSSENNSLTEQLDNIYEKLVE